MDQKVCTGPCGQTKPLDEFPRERRSKSGYAARCKVCRRAANAVWRAENPDKVQANNRRFLEANPEARKTYLAQWRQDNPERVRQYTARHRSLKLDAITGPVSYDLLRGSYPTCYLCGGELDADVHFDHVVPLARRGAHCMANLRPVHGSCNRRKCDRLLAELDWYTGPVDLGQSLG